MQVRVCEKHALVFCAPIAIGRRWQAKFCVCKGLACAEEVFVGMAGQGGYTINGQCNGKKCVLDGRCFVNGTKNGVWTVFNKNVGKKSKKY